MSPAPHPRMHGLTHLPGGPDPIPGWPFGSGGTATDYVAAILLEPCLQHYWKCDELSGNLNDSGPGGLDLPRSDTHVIGATTYPDYGAAGPLTDFPTLTAVYNAGTGGVASTHEGVFSASTAGNPDWTVGGNPFTIEAWLWLDEYPAQPGYAFVIGDTGSAVSFRLAGFGATSIRASIDTDLVEDPDPFPLDTWQHMAITSDGTTGKFYRGGVLVDSVASTDAPGSVAVNLLNQGGNTAFPWPGRVAHLAIYDCELTQAELQGHLATATPAGDVTGGYVWTADGAGGTSWEEPTIEIAKAGTLTGRRPRINLIEGANVTITTADDATDDEVDVTIAATGGGGGGAPGYGTSLPGSPSDGDEYILVDSTTAATYAWRFRYNASGGTYKWEFVGGSPITAAIDTNEATSSTTFVDLTTPGPSITVPRAGMYLISISADAYASSSAAAVVISYKLNAAATADGDGVVFAQAVANQEHQIERLMYPRTFAASDALKLQYRKSSTGTANFQRRQMQLIPVKVA